MAEASPEPWNLPTSPSRSPPVAVWERRNRKINKLFVCQLAETQWTSS